MPRVSSSIAVMGRPRIPLSVKLADGIDTSGGPDACHPWTRARGADGYGGVSWIDPETGRRKFTAASRAAYEVHHGVTLPRDVSVRHTCDNPPCCNPSHLVAGTHTDNMRDRIDHGAGYPQPLAKIPEATQEAIRAAYRPGVRGSGTPALAREFGVSRSQVQRIVTRR